MKKATICLKLNNQDLIETDLNGKKEELLQLLTTAILRKPIFRTLVSEAMMMVMTTEMEDLIDSKGEDLPTTNKQIIS